MVIRALLLLLNNGDNNTIQKTYLMFIRQREILVLPVLYIIYI